MQVHQNLSILFYRKRRKADKEGFIPIYCRITIDGLEDERSTGVKVLDHQWDTDGKQVVSTNPFHKGYNKKLWQMKADLERHFDFVVAKNGIATPALVFESYKTPLHGNQQKIEKRDNTGFSVDMDDTIRNYIKYNRQVENLQKFAHIQQARVTKLEREKQSLDEQVTALVKKGQAMFDNKSWTKTLMLATDEYLLNFLQLVIAGERAANTLKKKWGTKIRLQEFMQLRYKLEDISLAALEYKFISELVKNEKLTYKSKDNTVWKYTQILKEIMDRAVANGWMSNNVFSIYQCKYVEPRDKKWLSMPEMIRLINFEFYEKELSDIRDIFVYQSFAGPSYAELHALKQCHLVSGIDGKIWVEQNRRKSTSKETLPLLPICLEIIEKFRNHPPCQRSGKLLPVPSGQHYNRSFKRIGGAAGIQCLRNSHQARYFFANEVAYANLKDLKIIGILMGQRNANSVNTYVKPSIKSISANMQIVEEALYGQNGPLSKSSATATNGAKVVSISSRTTQI